ncbi:MAG: hypothetical protein KAG84_05345 [Bacteroidales bacterium]|nr:hypothetical protein [Bacteroidales bacterium]
MKKSTRFFFFMLLSISLIQVSCSKDDDKDATAPTLTTLEITDIKPTTVTTGGNITDNGGADITKRGVCYSSSNENPTLEKSNGYTEDGTGEGTFVSKPSGLLNGVKYYIAAYATNSKGTTYGNVRECTTIP